jgi:beta-mannanase
MIWGPNVAVAYPFGPGANLSPIPLAGSGPEFTALDTNKNGVIDFGDDPYGPYYPGDDVVDWVGISLYYYPFQIDNVALPAGYFADFLTASGPNMDYVNNNRPANFSAVRNFYERFAKGKGKPMLLPETGSPVLTDVPLKASEVDIKIEWYNQILSEDTKQK